MIPRSLWQLLSNSSIRNAIKLVTIVAFTILITWYRRPDQFTHPYVWVEDCAMNIKFFFEDGWRFVLKPYPSYIGYFAFPSKLLFALAATISFRWLPELNVAFATLFECLTLLAIAFSPTRLRYRTLCALAVLLIPTTSEVFGVSLYAGWWGSLLAILPLVWREGQSTTWQRIYRLLLLIVGGFSSPLIVGLVPLYFVRYYTNRDRERLIDFCVACGAATAQVVAVALQTIHFAPVYQWSGAFVPKLLTSFFGFFLYVKTGNGDAVTLIAGSALFAFLCIALMFYRSKLATATLYLCACLAIEIALVYGRQGTAELHPLMWGPRYFFFSYVTLAWVLLQIASAGQRGMRIAGAAFLVLMALNFFRVSPSHQVAMDWRAQVDNCLTTEGYKLPFHFDGSSANMGFTITSVEECRTLVSRSLFDNSIVNDPKTKP